MRDGHPEYRPVVDLFCATKSWWKSRLGEIPDLVLNNDYNWSQCLWAIFHQAGAKDLTGVCIRPETEKKWSGAQGKSSEHNAALAGKYIATSKVRSRYPKVSEQVQLMPLDTTKLPPYAYNPSIFKDGISGKISMTYRYHQNRGFPTRLGLCEVVRGVAVNPTDIALSGISNEDARMFSLHGKRWMSWVESSFLGERQPKSIVKYAALKTVPKYLNKKESFELGKIFQVKAGSNEWRSMQKNWCFFESDENLFCIYRSLPDQAVWQVKGETVVAEWNTPAPRWAYGEIRGGNIVPFEDKLLRIFHGSLDNEIGPVRRRYFIGAALMEPKPPFKTVTVSRRPIIYGSEIDSLKVAERKACHHWKANVVFPCGLVKDGENIVLALGVNDSACCLARLTRNDLNL